MTKTPSAARATIHRYAGALAIAVIGSWLGQVLAQLTFEPLTWRMLGAVLMSRPQGSGWRALNDASLIVFLEFYLVSGALLLGVKGLSFGTGSMERSLRLFFIAAIFGSGVFAWLVLAPANAWPLWLRCGAIIAIDGVARVFGL